MFPAEIFHTFYQGASQALKTLNDPKFDLVTTRNFSSTRFELNGLENPENCPQEILLKSISCL